MFAIEAVDHLWSGEEAPKIVLDAYDQMIGLDLTDISVDGCITKAPCGGERAGRSPVDRGKRSVKRSVAVDARGIPLAVVTAPANRHDSPLLEQTLDAARALGLLPEWMSAHDLDGLPMLAPMSGVAVVIAGAGVLYQADSM